MNAHIAGKLDEARALIEKGWCQHSFGDGASVCASTALIKATRGLPLRYQEARNFLDPFIGGAHNLFEFNDAPGRTQAEVIEAFRKAAELARQEQVL